MTPHISRNNDGVKTMTPTKGNYSRGSDEMRSNNSSSKVGGAVKTPETRKDASKTYHTNDIVVVDIHDTVNMVPSRIDDSKAHSVRQDTTEQNRSRNRYPQQSNTSNSKSDILSTHDNSVQNISSMRNIKILKSNPKTLPMDKSLDGINDNMVSLSLSEIKPEIGDSAMNNTIQNKPSNTKKEVKKKE
jgi:hypothetical protein